MYASKLIVMSLLILINIVMPSSIASASPHNLIRTYDLTSQLQEIWSLDMGDQELTDLLHSRGENFSIYSDYKQNQKLALSQDIFEKSNNENFYYFNTEILRIAHLAGHVKFSALKSWIQVFRLKNKLYKAYIDDNLSNLIYSYLEAPSTKYIDAIRFGSIISSYNSKRYNSLTGKLSKNKRELEIEYWKNNFNIKICHLRIEDGCIINIHKYFIENKKEYYENALADILCNVKIGINNKLITVTEC